MQPSFRTFIKISAAISLTINQVRAAQSNACGGLFPAWTMPYRYRPAAAPHRYRNGSARSPHPNKRHINLTYNDLLRLKYSQGSEHCFKSSQCVFYSLSELRSFYIITTVWNQFSNIWFNLKLFERLAHQWFIGIVLFIMNAGYKANNF